LAVVGAVRTRCGFCTVMFTVVVIALTEVSVTVKVWVPALYKVTLKVPVPLVSAESAGKVTPGAVSEVWKWMTWLDGKEVSTVPLAFKAVTLKESGLSEEVVVPADIERRG
jgi:hypothetical protein